MSTRFIHATSFALGTALSVFLWSMPTLAQTVDNPCPAPEPTSQTEHVEQPLPASTPAETGDETPTEAPPVSMQTTPTVLLSELFPDPEGSDEDGEFIEIMNAGAADADVSGWVLETSSGRTFALTARVATLGRYAFSFADTRLPLSNAGATITLRNQSGDIVDAVSYPGPAKTGRAYARDGAGSWRWTTFATPGSENAFDPELEPSPVPMPPAPADAPSAPPPIVEVPEGAPDVTAAADADHLRITEFLPDPAGSDDDEWVELHNAGDSELPLDGLFLDDAEDGSARFALSGIRIEAGGYALVYKSASNIALNNAGDAVRLLRADGGVITSVHYAIAPEGKSHAFIDGAWEWTAMPTPGAANAPAALQPAELAPADPAQPAAPDAEPIEEATLDEVSDADDETLVAVTGTVTLPPGTLGKRTFAIQDDTAAAIIRAHGNAAMPPLSAGDVVRVIGRKRDAHAFSTTGRMIERVGTNGVTYASREVDELSGGDAGLAVRLRGLVTRRTAKSFVIADEKYSAEATVRGDAFPEEDALLAGTAVTVRGVVRSRNGKVEIVAAVIESVEPPATDDDAGESVPAPIERERATFAVAAPKTSVTAPVAAGAAGSSIAAAALIALLRRRRAAEGGGLPVDG